MAFKRNTVTSSKNRTLKETAQISTEKAQWEDKDHERSASGGHVITSNVYSSCRGDIQEDKHRGRHQHQRGKTE